jgi:hypothetical protein
VDDPGLLRVSMPVACTEAHAYRRPLGMRVPHQFDRRSLPRPLRGDTIEAGRRMQGPGHGHGQGDALPFSLLTAQQLLEAVRVQVHVKVPPPPPLPGPGPGGDQELGGGEPHTQPPGTRHSEVAVRLGLPDIRPPSTTRSAAGAAAAPGGQDLHPSYVATAHQPPHAPWGASASLATSLRARTFGTQVYRASAATFKRRRGDRALARSLTEALWDDSRDALDQLTGKQGGGVLPEGGEDATDDNQDHNGTGVLNSCPHPMSQSTGDWQRVPLAGHLRHHQHQQPVVLTGHGQDAAPCVPTTPAAVEHDIMTNSSGAGAGVVPAGPSVGAQTAPPPHPGTSNDPLSRMPAPTHTGLTSLHLPRVTSSGGSTCDPLLRPDLAPGRGPSPGGASTAPSTTSLSQYPEAIRQVGGREGTVRQQANER